MTLANTTDKPLAEVQPYLLVSSAEDVDRPYWELETEYRDAKTGRWKTFHDAEPEDVFGFLAVGPRSTVTLQLRTRAVKNAKPGAGYALAAGDYRNRDGSCGSAKEAWSDFTVLPAGAKPTQPPTSKPSEPGKPGGTADTGQSAASGGSTGVPTPPVASARRAAPTSPRPAPRPRSRRSLSPAEPRWWSARVRSSACAAGRAWPVRAPRTSPRKPATTSPRT